MHTKNQHIDNQHVDYQVALQTLSWVRTFIVAHDICPFAQRELERDAIRVEVVRSKKIDVALEELMVEVQWLDEHPETETTLLVFPTLFKSFDHYLDFVELAERMLVDQGYEGVYQLATFHPDYCFDGAEPDDAANYTWDFFDKSKASLGWLVSIAMAIIAAGLIYWLGIHPGWVIGAILVAALLRPAGKKKAEGAA